MHILKLSPQQLEGLAWAVAKAEKEGIPLRLAFDTSDSAIKYKVGDEVWSPPYLTDGDGNVPVDLIPSTIARIDRVARLCKWSKDMSYGEKVPAWLPLRGSVLSYGEKVGRVATIAWISIDRKYETRG
jgi:hypothetical protein